MRIAFDPQLRFDSTPISDVRLNNHCRDEIIPILTALQHIYTQPQLRDQLLEAVARMSTPPPAPIAAGPASTTGRSSSSPPYAWAATSTRSAPGPRRGTPLLATHHGRRADGTTTSRSTGDASATTSPCSRPTPSNSSITGSSPRGIASSPTPPQGPLRLVRRRRQYPLSHRFRPDRDGLRVLIRTSRRLARPPGPARLDRDLM